MSIETIAKNELTIAICERIIEHVFPESKFGTRKVWQLCIGPVDELHYSEGKTEMIDDLGYLGDLNYSEIIEDFAEDDSEIEKIHDLLLGVRGALSETAFKQGVLNYQEIEYIIVNEIKKIRGDVHLSKGELITSTTLLKYFFDDFTRIATIVEYATKDPIESRDLMVYENWNKPRKIYKNEIADLLRNREQGSYAIWIRYPGPEIYNFKKELVKASDKPPPRLQKLIKRILQSGFYDSVPLSEIYKALWPQHKNPSIRVKNSETKHLIQKELSAASKFFGKCMTYS